MSCLLVGLFVCLYICLQSVCAQNYLRSYNWICMKLLPDLCIVPGKKPLYVMYDPDYDANRAAEV